MTTGCILERVKPNGDPVVKPDLCVCGPMSLATHGCSCEPQEETVLQEADRLVSSARGPAYGPPIDDFGKVVGMARALWGRGPETEEEHAIYMMLVKIAREAHKHKRDNLVDIAGYAKTLSLVIEARATSPNKGRPFPTNDTDAVIVKR